MFAYMHVFVQKINTQGCSTLVLAKSSHFLVYLIVTVAVLLYHATCILPNGIICIPAKLYSLHFGTIASLHLFASTCNGRKSNSPMLQCSLMCDMCSARKGAAHANICISQQPSALAATTRHRQCFAGGTSSRHRDGRATNNISQ